MTDLKQNDHVRTPKGNGRFIGYFNDSLTVQVALELKDMTADYLASRGIVSDVQTFLVSEVEKIG